jgi:hypothetical protein
MTVILQHQFWDLVVTEDRFEVGLSFNGIPERLVVPFNSIKSFFDPSVQFGLQFETEMAADTPASSSESAATAATSLAAPAAVPAPASEDDEPAKPGEGAEVVRLDRFRKK